MGEVLDKTGFMDAVRGMPQMVAWNAIIFGILLYLCDRFGLWVKTVEDMTLSQALIIGTAQALAIIPGTSRSGITMTAGRALGFERPEAARFSFLLGIPAIAGAGALKLGEAAQRGELIFHFFERTQDGLAICRDTEVVIGPGLAGDASAPAGIEDFRAVQGQQPTLGYP